MRTYRINGKTNPYIAQRDIHFNGKPEIVLETGLSLEKAQATLLEKYNRDHERISDPFRSTWAEARRWDDETFNHGGGCFGYNFDSRAYWIEEGE